MAGNCRDVDLPLKTVLEDSIGNIFIMNNYLRQLM